MMKLLTRLAAVAAMARPGSHGVLRPDLLL